MKAVILVACGAVALLGIARPAIAGCARELVSSDAGANLPLPPACRSLGPLRLGMTRGRMTAALGPPDQEVIEPTYTEAFYFFPRNATHGSRHHAKPVAPAHRHTGSIVVVLQFNRIKLLVATARSSTVLPYTVGGLALGTPVHELLRQIKTWPQWNMTHDNVLLLPYPIEFEVDASRKQRVYNIRIAARGWLYDGIVWPGQKMHPNP